jgi:hypothetical protein
MKNLVFRLSMVGLLTLTSSIYANGQAQGTKERKTDKTWSKKAKGAAIGGGVGAATGVIVSKNNSKGAVVGGVVGAGAGYLYGRHKDKKNPARKTVAKQGKQ